MELENNRKQGIKLSIKGINKKNDNFSRVGKLLIQCQFNYSSINKTMRDTVFNNVKRKSSESSRLESKPKFTAYKLGDPEQVS